MLIQFGVPDGIRTRVTAVKRAPLDVTDRKQGARLAYKVRFGALGNAYRTHNEPLELLDELKTSAGTWRQNLCRSSQNGSKTRIRIDR